MQTACPGMTARPKKNECTKEGTTGTACLLRFMHSKASEKNKHIITALDMKNKLWWWPALFAATLAGNLPATAQTPIQENNQLRIMSYNVRNGNGLDGTRSYRRIGDAIRKQRPQYVAIQEVDSMTGRSGHRDVLKELAIESGLYPTFGKAISFDGGSYGVGILSAERPLSVRRIALPGREEKRTLLIAEFERFVFGCMHLSLTEADQLASLPIIRQEVKRWNKPVVLAGDWNTEPGSQFINDFSKDFQIVTSPKQFTFPADQPTDCIDYIAIYKPGMASLVKRTAYVVNEPKASDHRPVFSLLQFKIPAAEMFRARPYLQNPTTDGITIMAQTSGRAHCWVEYGTDTLHLQRARTLLGGQAVCHDIEHKIRLQGLQPGQRYYYRVCAQEIIDYQSYSKTFGETGRTPFYSFTLPAADTQDFTALIMNDLHDVTSTINAFRKLAAEIPHDFTVFNGDCLAEPSDRDDAIRIITKLCDGFNAAETPIFFIRGNHEIRNAYSAGMPSLLDQPGGHTYGAFNWGDTRFVILDNGEDKEDSHWVYYGLNDFTQFRKEQADFLKKELKSKAFKKAKRRILMHHIPLWGNTDQYQPCRDLWMPLLEKADFDLCFNAHVHQFKYYPTGSEGNPFPIVRGGGYDAKGATMMVLTKKGKQLSLRVLNTEGKEIFRQDF